MTGRGEEEREGREWKERGGEREETRKGDGKVGSRRCDEVREEGWERVLQGEGQ